MGRNKAKGVEYFSHYTNTNGKTMYTLETMYGNDGYAFWFKTLELLGTQDELYYDCNDEPSWMFLVAKTRTTEQLATDILNLLAALGAIDTELWREHKIIWVQKFTDSLESVYKKRGAEIPQKPYSCDRNTRSDTKSDTESTQRKKERKESREEEIDIAEQTPPVVTLPLNDGSEYPISQAQVDEWQELYPSVDIKQQLRNMKGWLKSNPKRRKTKSGIQKFITGWLSREQNRGRASPGNGYFDVAGRM